jgi:hypothetical protein
MPAEPACCSPVCRLSCSRSRVGRQRGCIYSAMPANGLGKKNDLVVPEPAAGTMLDIGKRDIHADRR